MGKINVRLSALVMLLTSLMGFTACDDEEEEVLTGSWTVECISPLGQRASAVSFVIDNVAYIGTGVNTSIDDETGRFADFCSCTTSADRLKWLSGSSWKLTGQGVSSMPEVDDQGNRVEPRNGAVAFSLNGKGYVGLGYSRYHYLKDFWEFDPKGRPDPVQYPTLFSALTDDEKLSFGLNADGTPTGKWTKIADFPGDSCRYAVAFVLKGADGVKRAYVGSGEDYDGNKLCRFFKFDGEGWANTASCTVKRSSATAFVHESDGTGLAFVCGGDYEPGEEPVLEVFDPIKETWEVRQGVPEPSKSGVSFVIGDKAYITTGGYRDANDKTWEYDILNNTWAQKAGLGSIRRYAVSFVLECDGGQRKVPYVALGSGANPSVSLSAIPFYDDVWSFKP